ncbi:hypothetical protein ALC57_13494 [Trachymyrmex cornetzi]|uniref:Uncharacterized protein n=1 Tax=Trachymyrmex cornetzi TaxID=471704 RepID=A0A195DNB8_9HYME|nr:hypothetical protein ALC57_13494 [Trachymyrmex cornetzi]
MNWKNRLRRVEEDADDDGNGEENDDDDDEDDDYNSEGVLKAGLAEFRLLGSFERETRCSERFPRRRGRLDKAEEAE